MFGLDGGNNLLVIDGIKVGVGISKIKAALPIGDNVGITGVVIQSVLQLTCVVNDRNGATDDHLDTQTIALLGRCVFGAIDVG